MKNTQNNEYTESSNFMLEDASESGLSEIVFDSIDLLLKKEVVELLPKNDVTKIPFMDFLENIHSLNQDEILNKIPIVKTLYAFFKLNSDIKNRIFQKKLLLFLAGINTDDKEIKNKIDKSLSDPKRKKEMGEKLIKALELFDEINKADILCKLFLTYINETIDYTTFKELLFALEKVNFDYIEILVKFYDGKISGDAHNDILLILSGLRLIRVDHHSLPTEGQVIPPPYYKTKFYENDLGKNFIKVLHYGNPV
jgi:hypothetical protein